MENKLNTYNKIALIDGDFLFYVSLTGEKILDINGEPIKVDGRFSYRERSFEESCIIVDKYVTHLLDVTRADSYIGIFGGSSESRKRINLDYKANRKDLEPLPNMKEMKKYLNRKWTFHWMSGCIDETDDYIASCAKQLPNSFIISPDKDLLNLEGIHYNPKKNEWVNTSEETEFKFFWKSMVCGDAADNIKGLAGKGEKFVDSCLQFLSPSNYKILGSTIFDEYVKHYKYDYHLAIKEFYKNYFCLRLKTDLIIDSLTPIDYKKEVISDLEFDID